MIDPLILLGIYALLTVLSAFSLAIAVFLRSMTAFTVSVLTGAIFWLGLLFSIGVIAT